jgi:peptidoglycan hydrolase CwlO-like protein
MTDIKTRYFERRVSMPAQSLNQLMAALKRKQQKIKNLTQQLKAENTIVTKLKKDIQALKAKAATGKKGTTTKKGTKKTTTSARGRGRKKTTKAASTRKSTRKKTTKSPARKTTRKARDINLTIS